VSSPPSASEHVQTESTFQRLRRHVSPHRSRIRWATASSIVGKIFDLAPPFLIGAAVDLVVRREESFLAQRFGIVSTDTQLIVLGGLTFAIWFFESVFEYIQKILWRNLAQTIEHDLRMQAYRHVQGLDLAFFEDESTGGLMSVLNDDVNQLERFLDNGANSLIELATTVLIIGTAFFVMAPSVAWMAVLPMPFVIWGSIYFQRLVAPRYAAVREEVGILNSDLAGNLGGIATVKSFTAEEREDERIGQRSNAYREANRRAIQVSSAFSPLIRMIIVIGFTAMLIFGGKLAIAGGIQVGIYSIMVYLTQRLLWPLTKLGETLDLFQRAMASTSRIFGLLDTDATIQDGTTPLALADVHGAMAFDNVSFAYSNGFGVFEGVSFDIAAKQTTAIVGATGAGKSTIVKLLLRFYDVTGGSVTLDGRDLRELPLRDLRRSIGLVSQDVFLFHGTVAENIAYGQPDASRASIASAARAAEAEEFINALPQGYDTVVGERGQKLSGGQRQRISIARAVLKDPPILILDEATSSVDNETEAAIQRSLAHIAKGRTTVVIAHRLSTVRDADQIHVLENGCVVESGRHGDLLDLNGLYAALWRVQTGVAARSGG
jgi:ATP-binding cassette subfamily B protein